MGSKSSSSLSSFRRLFPLKGINSIEESFKAETYATSVGKARCNIAYQFRKKANIASHVPVTLVGDIIAMR
jgi:hypothetical protein